MHLVSSRSSTPSRSPQHSSPVPIPPAPSTDLHQANALRFRHLYGYTQPSLPSPPSFSSTSQYSETDSTESDYEDFVVETKQDEIVVDETDGSSLTTTEEEESSSSGSVLTSTDIFRFSNNADSGLVAESLAGEVFLENVEEECPVGHEAPTPRLAPSSPSKTNLLPVLDTISLGDVDFPPVSSVSTQRRAASRSQTPSTRRPNIAMRSHARHQSTGTSSRNAATQSAHDTALERLDDDFRCLTCYHAGLCTDLVIKDPNFKCGDTITGNGVSSRVLSAGDPTAVPRTGIGGRTPWTKQTLSDIGLGIKRSQAELDEEKGKLRVLDGGVDYVRYDDQDGFEDPGGGGHGVPDLEDIASGIRKTAITNQNAFDPVSFATTTTADVLESSDSTSILSIERPVRQTWKDVKVEYPSSSTTTSCESSSESSSFAHNVLSVCGNTEVHLETPIRTADLTQNRSKPMNLVDPKMGDSARPKNSTGNIKGGQGRSRSNPIWTLHNLTAGLFSGGSSHAGEGEVKYDHDDELYGVDVVERGRSRFR